MADWRDLRLGQAITLKRGFDLRTSDRDETGQIPVISSSGVTGHHNLAKVGGPGVVTGRYGSVGNVFFVDQPFWPLNTTLYVEDFKGNDERFIYYFLQRIPFHRFSDKTSVPGVNRNDLHRIQVNMPPVTEQKQIASVLDAWDKAIELTERLIEALEQRKKGLMQLLLTGDVRFPEYLNEEWKSVRLDVVVNEFIVPMRDKPKVFVGEIPWCRIDDFNGVFLGDSRSNRYVDEQTIQEMKLKVYPIGTVLCSCSANLGVCAITSAELVTNQTFIGLVTSEKLDNLFLYYYLTHFAHELQRRSSGTTISYLSREEFEQFSIRIPLSVNEQRRISSALYLCDQEIEAVNYYIELLTQQKKGLMQRLLTGQVRVKVD